MCLTMAATDESCSVKILVAADVHLRRRKLEALGAAVSKEKPEVVALNGDLLDVGATYRHQVGARDCAALLSGLPPCELVIVRGNHEDANWLDFLAAWSLESRRLTLLHGAAAQRGIQTG